jgi:Cupin
MAADPLSDLLKTVRLTGAVFFEIVAENPWAVGSPAREQILPKILPGADHLIAYHVVTTGRCFATAVGGQAIPLEAGQVVMFTNGQPHIMSSGPNMPAARSRRLRREAFLHQLRRRGGVGQACLRISGLRRATL